MRTQQTNNIRQFIGELQQNNYSAAYKKLSAVINNKIKQKIINNNTRIF